MSKPHASAVVLAGVDGDASDPRLGGSAVSALKTVDAAPCFDKCILRGVLSERFIAQVEKAGVQDIGAKVLHPLLKQYVASFVVVHSCRISFRDSTG